MVKTLSIVFVMHQWECILKLIQYQIPRAKQVAWTFSLTSRLENRMVAVFLLLPCNVLGSKRPSNCIIKHHKDIYLKVVQNLIDSYCVICKNFARSCGNLRIERSDTIFYQLCGSHHRTLSEALYKQELV